MSREKDTLFDSFIERICGVAKEKFSITAAAKVLHMTRQSLQNHKLRGTLPEKQAYRFCHETNTSPEWLLFGRGSQWIEYSEGEALSRAAGEYKIGDPELMLTIDSLLASTELKKIVGALIKIYEEGNKAKIEAIKAQLRVLMPNQKMEEEPPLDQDRKKTAR